MKLTGQNETDNTPFNLEAPKLIAAELGEHP